MSSPWPYRPDLTDDALRAMREEATRELGLEEPDPEPAPRPKWLGFVAVEVAWLAVIVAAFVGALAIVFKEVTR